MFLAWWTKGSTTQDSVATSSNDDRSAMLTDATIKREIQELEESLRQTSISRPSVISKSRYNKWAMSESNRLQAEQTRAEIDALQSQRQLSTTEFLDAGRERTQSAREQREAAAERVRQYKAAQLTRASGVRREAAARRQHDESERQQQLQQVIKLAKEHGAEQRERTLESRMERLERRRSAAADAKQAETARKEHKAALSLQKLEERRQRVAEIRAQTQPDIVRRAREHYLSQRHAVAADVRASVKDWKAEKSYKRQYTLQQARTIRASALACRESAIDHRNMLAADRHRDATAMRNNMQAIKERKHHEKLSADLARRRGHDHAFESKFVLTPHAETVVSSPYDTLANNHREQLAARAGKPGRVIGKPGWMPFFSHISSGWFGGQHLESCTL